MKGTWGISIFVIVVLAALSPLLLPRLYTNVAVIILNNTLWQENQPATERQESLRRSARWLRMAVGTKETAHTEDAMVSPTGMISSILRAEHYRRAGNLEMTTKWLHQASLAHATPPIQKALVLGHTIRLDTDGAIVVDSNTPGWSVRSDSPANAQVQVGSEGAIVFSWESKPEQRNRGSFVWRLPFNIPYHHTVVLDTKIDQDCRLIFETVIDQDLERHLRHPGTGQWEEVKTTVVGDHLTYMYIHLDDLTEERTQCQAEIRSISFVLDSAVSD